MEGGKYWESEEKRTYRMCGIKEENWKHVWGECTDWGREETWQEMVGLVLGKEGGGEKWMREVEERRGVRGEGVLGGGWSDERARERE